MQFKVSVPLLIGVGFLLGTVAGELEELFRWKQMQYTTNCASKHKPAFVFVDPDADGNQPSPADTAADTIYVPQNNLPMGVSHYQGRLFITMPRRRPGVPATLNVINLAAVAGDPSPKLTPYPDCETNILKFQGQKQSQSIVSVYRTRVDKCGRLWFVDTGLLEYPNNNQQVQRPSIWVMDLATNQQIRRFVIPESTGARSAGLPSITVDVMANACDDAFAYVPDLAANRLHVYSYRQNRMWTFRHNYFAFDPMQGDFDVANQRYQWDDGVFSVVLSPRDADGFRFAYFHAMVSTSEYAVSTRTLQNETAATLPSHRQGFVYVGNRGANKQSAMHDFDPVTGVIFYSEVGRNAVGCFNTRKSAFNADNHGTVAQDNTTMIYPSDLKVDDGTLWVMTNRLPLFVYASFDLQDYNFRLWRQTTEKAVAGTICQ